MADSELVQHGGITLAVTAPLVGFLFKLYRDSVNKRITEKDERIAKWEAVFKEERDRWEKRVAVKEDKISELEEKLYQSKK